MTPSIFRYAAALTSSLRNAARSVRSFGNAGGKTDKHEGIILGLLNNDSNRKFKLTDSAEKYDSTRKGVIKHILQRVPKVFLQSGSITLLKDVFQDTSVVIVGQNEEELETDTLNGRREKTRIACGLGTRILTEVGANSIMVDGLGLPESAAEGAVLSSWSYPTGVPVDGLYLLNEEDHKNWEEGVINASMQNFERQICEFPISRIDPNVFYNLTQKFLTNCPCVQVEIKNETYIEKKGLHAFIKLAIRSLVKPSLLEIKYAGANANVKPLVFVGNCLISNIGDASLKSEEKAKHKGQIAGGAIVVAIMKAISISKLNINVTIIVPAYMLSNTTQLVSCSSEQEIRLIMADLLSYAAEKNPRFLFTISTNRPTSDFRPYIYSYSSSIYTNTSFLWTEALKASDMTGDRVWRQPLARYFSALYGDIKDQCVTNKGSLPSIRESFLTSDEHPCPQWMHMDPTDVVLKSEYLEPVYYKEDVATN